MDPKYRGLFHLIYHGTCRDEEQLQNFQQPPLSKCGIPADANIFYLDATKIGMRSRIPLNKNHVVPFPFLTLSLNHSRK